MAQTSRRKFLGGSCSLLVTPFLAEQNPLQVDPRLPAAKRVEAPWREPGQPKDAEYLRHAALRYSADGREIVGRNRTCFNNRPLYCEPGTDCVALAGDRPFVRLLATPYVLGGFAAAIVRGGEGKWFHDFCEVESRYRCGRMNWRIHDPALAGVLVELDVVPLHGAGGFAARLRAKGLRAGDQMVWAFGGAKEEGNVRRRWDPIMRMNPNACKILGDPRKPEADLGLDPERCRGNQVTLDDQEFRVLAKEGATAVAVGRFDRAGKIRVTNASADATPVTLAQAAAGDLPMACGTLDLRTGEDTIFWTVEAQRPQSATKQLQIAAPAKSFEEAAAYLETVERIRVDTPDLRLNAAVAAVCHPIDASCDRDPFIFRHGCMAFFIHFLGWRVICGATALGWHDRVKGDAAYYAAVQNKDGEGHDQAQADPGRRLTIEGEHSRFYGRGRIPRDTHMYDTQTQFFDQIIRDWRWTGDAELEKILRPALELHLEWARDCFDPDDDGLYESYINTLPTDSVWYNGGGSVEESAYVYYGHKAAMDMARRAGDADAAAQHQKQAEKIKCALTELLWLKDRGHFGVYVEQGGHKRVHSDAWVYSEFLPIDAGMTTQEQALQALYYTEWGLERVPLPFGGEICQPSNWVPWKWSVRDVFGGDLCALALAYFQTGLADDGWEVLLGATLESAYASAVPGGFSQIGAGTDFSDNTHMFARTVVEGLFGFDPDYPNGLVRLHPAFPSSWPKASIHTPDYSLDYKQNGNTDSYRLTLTQEARVEFRLPVRAERMRRVTLNGQEVPWKVEPGFDCAWLRVDTEKLKVAEVVIEMHRRVPAMGAVKQEGKVGEQARLAAPRGHVVRWHDLHGVIESPRQNNSVLQGRLAARPGHHLVLAEVTLGDLPRWQVFKLHINDPEGEARLTAMTPREAPKDAGWKCLDMGPHYNGDIRTIFQQQYLSPRPKTCSVRLGVDGYSAWTFTFWHEKAPLIDLANLKTLTDDQGQILTPQNVPFAAMAEEKNIAFTSLWDNWPHSVSVPVNQSAEMAWMLVCGSTFPMQTRIANAAIHFRYADGRVERLELVPPLNFWNLCPWGGVDYNYATDAFCLPMQPPPAVQLGNNCRAMVLPWKLRPGVRLLDLTLETLSSDVVIGLMGVSLMNASS